MTYIAIRRGAGLPKYGNTILFADPRLFITLTGR